MATQLKSPELSRNAAAAFADKWKNFTDEKQHARGFWSDFFRALCGVDDEEIAGIEYEKRVKSTISGNQEYIDVYWKNVALIEHKSAGENLDKAELQARGYWLSLPPGYRPKTIIISDFLTFRLIDVALNRTHEFPLSKLAENIHRFEAIISGNRTRISEEEITVDQEAAKLMANLYLELEAHGFEGHETSIFLIRILFLLFGDDTGMWEKNSFLKLVMGTKEDGSDVGSKLGLLFDILNSPSEKRPEDLAEELKYFPYVNGGIFSEKISLIDFNKKMRIALVDVANYNWTTINPTIFGSLFQLIKNKEARRELGEHYTSEENINKIVYPLFLDELQERLAAAWDNKKELKRLRQDFANIKIFDPACGCGNFLVVAYRHLRQLELELIVRLNHLEGTQDSIQLDGSMGLSVTLNQFYGIEIEEWPAQIARIAIFLTDHQENLKFTRITGETPNRFPIKDMAQIYQGNALRMDWNKVCQLDSQTYILGNPPFLGSTFQSKEQKEDTSLIWGNTPSSGILDYVSNWYIKTAQYVAETHSRAAFVSTNSITQGQQPPVIWGALKGLGIGIDFAHRTFNWKNYSHGEAGVHCVIIGFSIEKKNSLRKLWFYSQPDSEPVCKEVKNINAYLIDAVDVLVASRRKPISAKTQTMDNGSKPADAGFLSNLTLEEAQDIREKDPIATKFLRPIIGAREFLHSEERWCLWLVDADPSDIKNSRELSSRISSVRQMRAASTDKMTLQDANRPSEFQKIRQPLTPYLVIPLTSSENRSYLPVARYEPNIVVTNAVSWIADPSLTTFGILSSSVFMLWAKSVSGRLESRIRISNNITYNNFPFLELSPQSKEEIDHASQTVLDVRKSFPGSSLAVLYDSDAMPPALSKAHYLLDAAVLKSYGLAKNSPENEILEKLFEKFEMLTSQKKD